MVAITEHEVLLALHWVEWRYGIQILERISGAAGLSRLPMGNLGKLQAVIDRLIAAGLVEGKLGDASGSRYRPRRVYYRLTQSGHQRRMELESAASARHKGLVPKPA
ncbi:MAG: helix-turn-helix transcriptional regulator [Candidatus Doudnabacteria bacterium]|nr:helix-turn-helix transcriptional regulator [Candidatus Doudnabacteria bacterium]